jgi:hypothetical protein
MKNELTADRESERPVIREIVCVRKCGYIRPYTDTRAWLTRIIDHPVYGLVNGRQLVETEVWNHDCKMFLERRAHAREISGYSGRIHR